MEHDYYKILGVSPTVDFETLKKAFRSKVFECHPDRGGSHAEMVLVNEAWEVLSNPELRSRYDEARTNAGDRAAQEVAQNDARQARQRAEQYPRRWAEVEAWLARDFVGAQYGYTTNACGFSWPKVDSSLSGTLFVIVGAILGWVFLQPITDYFFDSIDSAVRDPEPESSGAGLAMGPGGARVAHTRIDVGSRTTSPGSSRIPGARDQKPGSQEWRDRALDIAVRQARERQARERLRNPPRHGNGMSQAYSLFLPVMLGAFAGMYIHMCIGEAIKYAKKKSSWLAQPQQERPAERDQAASPPDAPREPRVLVCGRCGQKLRVPSMQAELLVTCTACGHKFSCTPA